MINDLIYWVGAVTIISLGILCSMVFIHLIIGLARRKLVEILCSTYNHAQLLWFMKELKKKGYAQAIYEIGVDTKPKFVNNKECIDE